MELLAHAEYRTLPQQDECTAMVVYGDAPGYVARIVQVANGTIVPNPLGLPQSFVETANQTVTLGDSKGHPLDTVPWSVTIGVDMWGQLTWSP